MTEEAKEGPEKTEAQPAAADAAGAKAPAGFRWLLGEKKGMTQIFTQEGKAVSVTVIEAGPCPVYCVRTQEKDGYSAIQLGFGARKEKNLPKPLLGQYKAASLKPAKHLKEFRVSATQGFAVGQLVTIEGRFKPLDYVDVQGISKGRGFAGVMKRHNFRGLPGSHGASDKERSPGSLTARRALGRVLPGQRMAGHLGNVTTTIHKMEIVQVESEKNLIYINGAVPGPIGGLVAVGETVKNRKVRVIRKIVTVLRDKMGNIIKAKGAKAAAAATKEKPAEKK